MICALFWEVVWSTSLRLRAPPPGFVDLRTLGISVEARYHTADNFTAAPMPGYGAPGAWLVEPAATSLASVHAALAVEGLGLRVYDAYRPRRASAAMVAWAERSGQTWTLEQGYVAQYSGHNKGNTVDVTLYDLRTGAALDMGGAYDDFSIVSHFNQATGAARAHRETLRTAMMAAGWRPYSKEWWHFSFPMDGLRPRDVPYGCFEPDEGAWRPPAGWKTAAWEPPKTWPMTPCTQP